MGLSSTAFEFVLRVFDKRDKMYTFEPKAEETPVLPGRETSPVSSSVAEEKSTGKQIIQNHCLHKVGS